MIILGLDTAQGACSAALWRGEADSEGQVLARRFELMRSGHAERLLPQVMEVMAEAGLKMADLDRLASTIGPGSFTGTRVALAAARGMALALDIPLIGVTTLEAVATGLPLGKGKVRIAVFDARRGELYLQAFDGAELTALSDPGLFKVDAAATAIIAVAAGRPIEIAGTGAQLLADALAGQGVRAEVPEAEPHPDAALVARIAAGRAIPAIPPAPLYLRAPDAKLPEPK